MTFFGWLSRKRSSGPKPADGQAPVFSLHASQPSTSTVMVTLIGVDPQQIDEIIDVTGRRFARAHKVVYITDSLDFMQFRNRGAIFEYLPSTLEQKLHASEINWHAYLGKRWQLLLSKWRPLHVLSYGHNIDGYLAAAPRMTEWSNG